MYFTGEPPVGYTDPHEVQWKRPEEFITDGSDPDFISEGASANDVK